ncbi:hypothetical protein EIP91_001906 [Steccherinum ochraceum]|uniref:F-box domain-containing protein n=1 Tax=Steccherinum ochraceum TaxID=92696 RepID=A0A4R0RFJ4_9APHY|nr:hypothetical protein EIP91_001906 [Steccherinum ochraceum]
MVSLPPELWLAIFRHAVTTGLTASLFSTTYQPFEVTSETSTDHSLKVKLTIIRVCKLWRDLAISLLYEDLLVLHEYSGDLRRALERRMDEEATEGSRSRRVCLPYSSTVPQMATKYPTDAVTILTRCPSLEVLSRPSMVYGSQGEFELFEYAAEDCPPLPSLKRLDWWHRNDAARSGGVNCLVDVLQAAPNITYLSLEGELGLSVMQLNSEIVLAGLTTLRLRRVNMLFILQISKWSFPSLETVILDGYTNTFMLQNVGSAFGGRLKRLELGRSLRFYINDVLSHIFEWCPTLEEINYYAYFTYAPDLLPAPHQHLTAVGLHGVKNPIFMDHEPHHWHHLEAHFATYCVAESYLALRTIRLHGDWQHVFSHPEYPSWVDNL